MNRIRTIAALLVIALIACVIPGYADAKGVAYADPVEIVAYLKSRTNRLDEEISFSYSAEMDEYFADSDFLQQTLHNDFAVSYRWRIDNKSRSVYVTQIKYNPGFRAANADRIGRPDLLDERELQILEIAKSIVAEAQAQCDNLLSLEKYLHDEICRRTTYKESPYEPGDEGFTTYDTAFGVLLYGEAECDGYSDTFYLLGTLAGLNVGLLCGCTESSGIGHIWNLVEINREWYHVDVTWDDLDDEDDALISYRFMNVTSDYLYDHSWVTQYFNSYPLAEEMNWAAYVYSSQQFGLYAKDETAAGQQVAALYKSGVREFNFMIDGTSFDSDSFGKALGNAGVRTRYTYYSREPIGNYICLDMKAE